MRLLPTLLLQLPLLLALACADSGGNDDDSETPSNDDDNPVGDDTANDDDVIEPRCGDSVLDAGEQCETGRGDINCDAECRWAMRPFFAYSEDYPVTVNDLKVNNGRLYVADAEGISVYDVSNPGGIRKLSRFEYSGGFGGGFMALAIAKGRVVVSRTYDFLAFDHDADGNLMPAESIAHVHSDHPPVVRMASNGRLIAGLQGDGGLELIEPGPPLRSLIQRPSQEGIIQQALIGGGFVSGSVMIDEDDTIYRTFTPWMQGLGTMGTISQWKLDASSNWLESVEPQVRTPYSSGGIVKANGYFWTIRFQTYEGESASPGIDRFESLESLGYPSGPPTVPVELGTTLEKLGNYLYTSDGGLVAIDIRDPLSPVVRESYGRFKSALLAVDENCAYMLNQDTGLEAFCCLPGMCGEE